MPSFPIRFLALFVAAASLAGCAGFAERGDVLGRAFYVAQFCTPAGVGARPNLPVLVLSNTHSEGIDYARVPGSAPVNVYQGRAGAVQYAVAAIVRWVPGQQYVWEMGRFEPRPAGQWTPWLPASFVSADGNLAWAMVNVEPFQRSDTVPRDAPKMRVMTLPYGTAAPVPAATAEPAGC